MALQYQNTFTFAYPIVDGSPVSFMEHTDGAVSCAIRWSGIDYEASHSSSDLAGRFSDLYRMFRSAAQYTDLVMEHHLFRGMDVRSCDDYYSYGIDHVFPDRNPELALRIRRELANHLAQYARHNDVYIVFLLKPKFGFFSGKGEKAVAGRKRHLAAIVNELAGFLPGDSSLLSIDEYTSLMLRANNPAVVSDGAVTVPYNYRFSATNRLIKPVVDHTLNCLRTPENRFHRVVALLDYPDAEQDWQVSLSRCSADQVHVVQVVRPLDAQAVALSSAAATRQSSEAAALLGGESVQGKLQDHADFRSFVQDNNLSVHANCFVVVLTSNTPDDLVIVHKDLCRTLRQYEGTVIVTDDLDVELAYFHTATPGAGYLSPYMRPDHDLQVAHMTPCFAQSHGDMAHPEVGYITSAGTFVGQRYQKNHLHHGATAAKTASGKSVATAAQVAQLYPLGFNFYLIEVGRSFEYLVKAYGGEYHALDADTTIISPFASYAEMDRISQVLDDAEEGADGVIPATAVSTIRRCLIPIVLATSDTDNITGLVHYESVLDDVIQVLYTPGSHDDSIDGPTLKTLLDIGSEYHAYLYTEGDHRSEHLKTMLENLSSFLSTSEGSVFTKADTLKFESGLIGIDFGELIRGNAENLSKYLLLFVITRLQQLAFTRPEQTFIILDEDHEYTAIDRKLMDTVKRQVTKRGRKSAAFINPISQSVEDIAYNEDGTVNTKVINQMSNFLLLFYGTDHGDLASVFKLPERAETIWKSYPDPVAPGRALDYRQGLLARSGEFWDLFITWPKILSDITNTNPDAMQLKARLLSECDGDGVRALERFSEEYQS
jgi:hypothetical protein